MEILDTALSAKNTSFSPDERSFTVEVRELPDVSGERTIYYLTNTKKNPQLKDVVFPEEWGSGWSWKYVDERAAEIREYLDRHPEITSFVSFDDRNLEKGLLGRFIWTNNHISEEDMKNCIRLLNIEDGPFLLDDSMKPEGLQSWREKYVYPHFPKSIG